MAETPKSNTTDATSGGNPLESLSPADLSNFELTGALPSDAKADDAPADTHGEAAAPAPDDQAASTEALSPSGTEPGKPAPKAAKQPGQKKSATERADELARENDAAEQRLRHELRRRKDVNRQLEDLDRESPKAAKPAEAAAADTKKDPEWKKYRDDPEFPKSNDYEGLDEWVAACSVFIADKRADARFGELYDQRTTAERATYERDEAFVHAVNSLETRAAKELAADPGIMDRIDPGFRGLNPSDRLPPGQKPTIVHWIKDQVSFKSEHPLKLSEWLTENGSAELKRLVREVRDPEQILRAIAIKDHSFGPGSADDGADEAAAEQPSRVSKAPAPAKVLGKKPASGVDPTSKAIAENDFDTFNELETRREARA